MVLVNFKTVAINFIFMICKLTIESENKENIINYPSPFPNIIKRKMDD